MRSLRAVAGWTPAGRQERLEADAAWPLAYVAALSALLNSKSVARVRAACGVKVDCAAWSNATAAA